MSTSSPAIEGCRPADGEPVVLPAGTLESTAPEYLRELQAELSRRGQVPVELAIEARFEEDCSFATQDEIERVREHVRAADFLGVSRVAVEVTEVADEQKVRPALSACAERARREGVTLRVDGPLSLG